MRFPKLSLKKFNQHEKEKVFEVRTEKPFYILAWDTRIQGKETEITKYIFYSEIAKAIMEIQNLLNAGASTDRIRLYKAVIIEGDIFKLEKVGWDIIASLVAKVK